MNMIFTGCLMAAEAPRHGGPNSILLPADPTGPVIASDR